MGVGGVFTIIGAKLSLCGGVEGAALVSIGEILAVRGRSGDEAVETGCEDGLSGKMEPILDATLPRLLSVFSFCSDPTVPPPGLRSGLVFGLAPFFGFRTSFNLPTGEGERL